MNLAPLIQRFFHHYLPHIKGVSPITVKAYRDAFKLFLPFAAHYHHIKIKSLQLEHLSSELILAFLNGLEQERQNLPKTRNHRLAVLKSFAKMVRLIYPEKTELAERVQRIPQKRTQKPLIGFLYQEEILQVFETVDLRKPEGIRDYALLHLLYDSGARASEMATLNLDYFNPQHNTLAILGKGNRFRLISIMPRTSQLLQLYITQYRTKPKLPYQHRLFISQRREELTRHGIYRICKKYLSKALPPKRLKAINPVHSFRHACAVHRLHQGESLPDIKNHLGHDNIQSTTIYLHLDLSRRLHIQKQLIKYMQSVLSDDPKIDELLQWDNKEDIMAWLDTL